MALGAKDRKLKSALARASGALAIAALLLSGCDTSSALFSDEEKSAIYSLSFSASGSRLEGAAVKAGDSVVVAVKSMSGAAEGDRLSLSVESADGSPLASLDYVAGTAAKAALLSSGRRELGVDRISGSLPAFALPSTLGPGSYRLVATLSSASGAQLARTETVFFVAAEGFGLGSLSLCPAAPAPGAAVLLSVAPREGDEGAAWLRWSSEGRIFAEGPLSAGFDKVVWRAPRLEGAYALSAELFPSRPPDDSASAATSSPWRQETKAIVAPSLLASSDEYADPGRFVSHFAFEGDFADSGTRAQGEKPQSFGSPSLAAYPGGFGYGFGPASGLSAPGALPKSPRFSLLARLYSEEESGSILSLTSADGSAILRLGVEKRVPFVELRGADGQVSRSSAPPKAAVQPGLLNLGLSFAPRGDKVELVWSVEGERFSSPELPRPSFSDGAKCLLGGPGSLAGVYDEVAISEDAQSGPPPLYAAASARKYGADLFIASGFEPSSLPLGSVSSGKLSPEPRRLVLGPASRLSFSQALPSARALRLELDFAEEGGALALEMSPAPSPVEAAASAPPPLFSLDSGGNLRAQDGSLLGILPPEGKGRLAFSLKASAGGFELASASGLAVAHIKAPASSSRLLLSIANGGSSGSVALSRLLVRAAPEYLSLAETPRYARLR